MTCRITAVNYCTNLMVLNLEHPPGGVTHSCRAPTKVDSSRTNQHADVGVGSHIV